MLASIQPVFISFATWYTIQALSWLPDARNTGCQRSHHVTISWHAIKFFDFFETITQEVEWLDDLIQCGSWLGPSVTLCSNSIRISNKAVAGVKKHNQASMNHVSQSGPLWDTCMLYFYFQGWFVQLSIFPPMIDPIGNQVLEYFFLWK